MTKEELVELIQAGERDLNMDHAARMCPVCGEDSRVYDSREAADGRIHRKRYCLCCGAKFCTVESFECMIPVKSPSRSRA